MRRLYICLVLKFIPDIYREEDFKIYNGDSWGQMGTGRHRGQKGSYTAGAELHKFWKQMELACETFWWKSLLPPFLTIVKLLLENIWHPKVPFSAPQEWHWRQPWLSENLLVSQLSQRTNGYGEVVDNILVTVCLWVPSDPASVDQFFEISTQPPTKFKIFTWDRFYSIIAALSSLSIDWKLSMSR